MSNNSRMHNIEIRRLQADDVEDFRTIRLSSLKKAPEMFGTVYCDEAKKPVRAFLGRLIDAVVFGAYVDDKIVGLMVLKQENGIKDAHKSYLSGVFVEPELRNLGIANALLDKVIEYAEEHVEQIMLTVVEGNNAAISLYKKYGFVPYGVEPRAMKTEQGYLNEVLMALVLR
ncbi:MAG: N-acetyltransferase family protein [Pseudomonas piscis]|uniref:GNAT family N-acetyltransferase n=1 Tax=Pseudomonas piscis TaxID=2614538 RepID=UPI003D2A2B20